MFCGVKEGQAFSLRLGDGLAPVRKGEVSNATCTLTGIGAQNVIKILMACGDVGGLGIDRVVIQQLCENAP